jgi:polar amino acid transport system permease protein
MGFDLGVLERYGSRLFSGFAVTLEILLLSCLFGMVIAVAANVLARSRLPFARPLVDGYIFFFRGTPLLAQAFLIYFGAGEFRPWLEAAGLWGVFREAFWCGVMALSLNTGAYTAAILDGALRSVPQGLVEACTSLGFRPWRAFHLIILPLAVRYSLPSYINEVISSLKGTSVLSVISVDEMMSQTRLVFSRTLAFEIFLMAGAIYLLAALLFQLLLRHVQSRLEKHL